jgi:hypothetical protein
MFTKALLTPIIILSALLAFFTIRDNPGDLVETSIISEGINRSHGVSPTGDGQRDALTNAKLDCELSNPFKRDGFKDCIDTSPSSEVVAQSESTDVDDLAANFKTRLVHDFLYGHPGAALSALRASFECKTALSKGRTLSGPEQTECSELSEIRPRVLTWVWSLAERGDAEAALLLARHYLNRSMSVQQEYRTEFTKELEKYLVLASPKYPDQVASYRQELLSVRELSVEDGDEN